MKDRLAFARGLLPTLLLFLLPLYFVALASVLSLLSCGRLTENRLTSSLERMPADGTSAGQIVLSRSPFGPEETLVLPENKGLFRILAHERQGNRETLYIKSSRKPGTVQFRTTLGKSLTLHFYEDFSDLDGDGFPDRAELHTEEDRRAFREWFVTVAESQYMKRSHSWNPGERDCSGLIRFAYREALKRHDERWFARSGVQLDKNIPDIKEFHYPELPVLGERLFRISQGKKSELANFGSFADAGSLIRYNTFRIGRNVEEAREGDLLFFRNDWNPRYPYHSMIVAGKENGEIIVLYHTGTDDILKRAPVGYLSGSPRFNPVPYNPNFLGVYRFNILE